MTNYAYHLFGRELPERAIIRAGAHTGQRAQFTLQYFDEVGEFHGSWMPFCFAWKGGLEFLVIFNVYGAAPTLEIMRLFDQGGVNQIGFVGAAYSKQDEIGHQLLVKQVYDRAGVVLMVADELITRDEAIVEEQRQLFDKYNLPFSEVTLVSVPCVMHNLEPVLTFIDSDKVDGIEMELSTFFYFGQQQQMKTLAYVYTSDNPRHNLIAEETKKLKNEAMALSSKLVIEHLLNAS